MKKSMSIDEAMDDKIIKEVRSIREALAARFDYDLDLLFEEAKRREQRSDRVFLAPSPKRLSPSTSA